MTAPILALLPQFDLEGFSAQTLYMVCAAVGGAVLTIQLLLLMIGGDVEDGEVDGDSDGFSFLSIRAVASFLTFFGLIGLYGQRQGWSEAVSAAAAVGSGLGMMIAVAWLFSLQSKLHQEGTLDPKAAVGRQARVYLRVPPSGEGKGKITVALQGRTAEYSAVSDGDEIPTGADVVVERMVNETTFVVRPS